jgi:nicotinate-nucleotide--dimethylbenzimidazole phosphoribosyltransferase
MLSKPRIRQTVEKWISAIPLLGRGPDALESHERRIRAHWDLLTKPKGSLGKLESIGTWFGLIHGKDRLPEPHCCVCVFAADHGVTEAGVSAYPSAVTREMVRTFTSGGAAINVLTRRLGLRLEVVDVGVNGDLSGWTGVVHRKVAAGTKNFLEEPAMLPETGLAAMEVGRDMAHALIGQGVTLLVPGEMGIGNTTSSSALAAALLLMPPEEVTGRGTGLDDSSYRKKIRVIENAVGIYTPLMATSLDWLWAVGGLEIAAIAGFIIGAAEKRTPVVLDGLITSAAALVVYKLFPEISSYLLAGHVGHEPGHRKILDAMGLDPLLNLDLRLGEGTGGALAASLVRSSVCLYNEMATFESAQVSGPN